MNSKKIRDKWLCWCTYQWLDWLLVIRHAAELGGHWTPDVNNKRYQHTAALMMTMIQWYESEVRKQSKAVYPNWHTIGYFRDELSRQSSAMVLTTKSQQPRQRTLWTQTSCQWAVVLRWHPKGGFLTGEISRGFVGMSRANVHLFGENSLQRLIFRGETSQGNVWENFLGWVSTSPCRIPSVYEYQL